MGEPRLEAFGLKSIHPNEYELLNKTKPTLTDYGLTDDDYRKIKSNRIDRQIEIISYILVIITASGILQIDYASIISNLYSTIVTSFYKSIMSGIVAIASYLIITIFIGFFIMYLTMFISIPVAMLMQKIVNKSLNNYSDKHQRYLDYNTSLNNYNMDLQTAIKDYESARYQYNLNEKRKQIDFWKSLDGRSFEKQMAILFQKQGYAAQLTPASNDHGIDINLRQGNNKIIVQCKQHAKPVGPHVVRDLFGTMIASQADEAILVCTSGFTSGVYTYVKGKNITLMDIYDILEMAK